MKIKKIMTAGNLSMTTHSPGENADSDFTKIIAAAN